MLASIIIQARTLENDYPGTGLLVYPDDFSQEKVAWAKEYITNSTRFFELASQKGRRVIFADSTTLVTGVSMLIEELYALCQKEPKYNKVNLTRTNYAFIGFAIPKSEISDAFDVPYTLFLEQYEKWMGKLWNTEYQENGMFCTKAEYLNVDFPAAKDVFAFPAISSKERTVVDEKSFELDSVCAGITMAFKKYNDIGFCSNVPNAKSVIESKFVVVSAQDAKEIENALRHDYGAKESSDKSDFQKNGHSPFSLFNSKGVFDGLKKRWDETPPEEKKKKALKVGTVALTLGGILINILKKNNRSL